MEQDPEEGMDNALKCFGIGVFGVIIGVGLALGWEWALIILGAVFLVTGVIAYFEFSRQKNLIDRERRYRQKELIGDESDRT